MTLEFFVVLLPLFGAMLAMPVGRAAGPRAAELVTTALVGLAATIGGGVVAGVFFGVAAHLGRDARDT